MALRTRPPGARALLPATRSRSSGQLEALLSSPVLGVRLMTALQVLQVRWVPRAIHSLVIEKIRPTGYGAVRWSVRGGASPVHSTQVTPEHTHAPPDFPPSPDLAAAARPAAVVGVAVVGGRVVCWLLGWLFVGFPPGSRQGQGSTHIDMEKDMWILRVLCWY